MAAGDSDDDDEDEEDQDDDDEDSEEAKPVVSAKKVTKQPAAKVVEDSDSDDEDEEDADDKLVAMDSDDSDDGEEVDLEKVMQAATKKAKTSSAPAGILKKAPQQPVQQQTKE